MYTEKLQYIKSNKNMMLFNLHVYTRENHSQILPHGVFHIKQTTITKYIRIYANKWLKIKSKQPKSKIHNYEDENVIPI